MTKNSNCANPLRRRFLRRTTVVAATAVFPAILSPSKTHAADTMTLLAWYGNGEPDVVGAFE